LHTLLHVDVVHVGLPSPFPNTFRFPWHKAHTQPTIEPSPSTVYLLHITFTQHRQAWPIIGPSYAVCALRPFPQSPHSQFNDIVHTTMSSHVKMRITPFNSRWLPAYAGIQRMLAFSVCWHSACACIRSGLGWHGLASRRLSRAQLHPDAILRAQPMALSAVQQIRHGRLCAHLDALRNVHVHAR